MGTDLSDLWRSFTKWLHPAQNHWGGGNLDWLALSSGPADLICEERRFGLMVLGNCPCFNSDFDLPEALYKEQDCQRSILKGCTNVVMEREKSLGWSPSYCQVGCLLFVKLSWEIIYSLKDSFGSSLKVWISTTYLKGATLDGHSAKAVWLCFRLLCMRLIDRFLLQYEWLGLVEIDDVSQLCRQACSVWELYASEHCRRILYGIAEVGLSQLGWEHGMKDSRVVPEIFVLIGLRLEAEKISASVVLEARLFTCIAVG